MAKLTVGETIFETCRAFPRMSKDGKTFYSELKPENVYSNKDSQYILIQVTAKDGHEMFHKIRLDQIISAFKISGNGKKGPYVRIVKDPGGNESLEMRMLRASYENN